MVNTSCRRSSMTVPASERPPDILISISGLKRYVVRDVVTIGSARRGIRAKQRGQEGEEEFGHLLSEDL